MDFGRLRQIGALFQYDWDPFVIGSLVTGPLRFSELSHAVTLNRGVRIPDSTLTEIKDRLIRTGVLEITDDGKGHPVYRLTDRGKARADVIDALTDAIPDEYEIRQHSATH